MQAELTGHLGGVVRLASSTRMMSSTTVLSISAAVLRRVLAAL